jgi:poly-gamma-glutamate biosynthesis protein PgsC/CapC
MTDIATVAIGIGLVFSLVFSELFSLAAGGMVVPGYLALEIDEPARILATVGVAYVTWLVVAGLAQYIIIYGRRRTVIMILTGFVLNVIFDRYISVNLEATETALSAIGHIIPGLIAIWFDRQGAIATVATLTITIVAVRLVLILMYGTELTL